mmetsp:Transcript_24427/g.44901  ORF Transcript_24427/g.44901 Transcript_24427/m.44901 type:complete len:308 (-) Transcript_24427:8-931(-)
MRYFQRDSYRVHSHFIEYVFPSPSSIKKTQGVQRVKFRCIRQSSDPKVKSTEWKPLAKALMISEELGAAPVLQDGRIGGNGAILCGDSIIVSKSGRFAGTQYDASQFVRVSTFDFPTWTVTYSSTDPTAKPSSDIPLLWHAMKVAHKEFGWTKQPKFVLHGHTCKTAKEAKVLGAPCSTKETLFSTPADLDALIHLFEKFPYPQHHFFVRLNHGFFLLADTVQEAIHLFKTKLAAVMPSSSSTASNNGTDNNVVNTKKAAAKRPNNSQSQLQRRKKRRLSANSDESARTQEADPVSLPSKNLVLKEG